MNAASPIIMQDGRFLSNHLPPRDITQNMRRSQGFHNHHDFRKFLQNNAQHIIDAENRYWQSAIKPIII